MTASPAKQGSGKERILLAAERLFADRGFLGVSAAEIAREAGVAHGLLFHHYGSMEDLYAQVSKLAASRMDEVQLSAFKGKGARAQVESFLRAHMRAMKQRQGDAVFRARSGDVPAGKAIADIWEASRQRAIDKLIEVLDIPQPTRKSRLCLRAWLGFHDQLVLGWLVDGTVTEAEVLAWTLQQLEHLAATILSSELELPA